MIRLDDIQRDYLKLPPEPPVDPIIARYRAARCQHRIYWNDDDARGVYVIICPLCGVQADVTMSAFQDATLLYDTIRAVFGVPILGAPIHYV